MRWPWRSPRWRPRTGAGGPPPSARPFAPDLGSVPSAPPVGGGPRRQPARWARPSDLGDLVVGPSGAAPVGRLVLGRAGRRLVAAERAQSVIVFGPTQSHKTSGFAVPAILGWTGPVVAASVKGDLLEHTAGTAPRWG